MPDSVAETVVVAEKLKVLGKEVTDMETSACEGCAVVVEGGGKAV